MTQSTSPMNQKEKLLSKALTAMLKPLVRLLIQQNITYIGLQNLLKPIFVEVAAADFKLPGKKQTDSRVSLLTAIHRGEVKRIREAGQATLSVKEIKASVSAQMMSVWLGHQAYLNEQGKPMALFRQASEGSPSFEGLVLSVSKDKHPRSILDDWLTQKTVSILDNGRIQLNETGYVPAEDFEEKLFFAGKNVGSHLSVVANNLQPQTTPMFDRAVFYQNLSEASVEKLEIATKEKMMAVLTEMNQLASELQEKDAQAPEAAKHRIHIGAYFEKGNAT